MRVSIQDERSNVYWMHNFQRKEQKTMVSKFKFFSQKPFNLYTMEAA